MTWIDNAERSAAVGLRCIDCGLGFALDYVRRCPRCPGLLVVEYDLDMAAKLGIGNGPGGGIWRWDRLLPPTAHDHRVTLGEGMSPLLPARRLADRLGLRDVRLKLEGVNPTGSMKDRSSATAIAAALGFGFRRVGCVSSGNMGSSIANYAARAGLQAFVFSAAYASENQLDHMAAGTSDMHVYDEPYDAMAAAIQPVFDEGLAFDAGSSFNPYNSEGQKTLAFEIVEQLGERSPDVVVYPLGAADLFLAATRGFEQYAYAGFTDSAPLPVVAQSRASASVVRALDGGGDYEAVEAGDSIAGGVLVGDMGAKGHLALRKLREVRGLGAAVEDDEVAEWQTWLARNEGVWAGPTASVVLPALEKLTASGAIGRDASVVVVLSETGLKGGQPPHRPPTVEASEAVLRELFGAA